MSHCTTMQIQFKDKHLLFQSMRNLGMQPESQVWASYRTHFNKMLGIGGDVLGKLLTGTWKNLHIFFLPENDILKLHVESPVLDGLPLEIAGKAVAKSIQKEYVRCAVRRLANRITSLGGEAEVFEAESTNGFSIILSMEAGAKKVDISLDTSGNITEKVSGVKGKSCIDLTQSMESVLAGESDRSWTYEYDVMLEDEAVQVLHLE